MGFISGIKTKFTLFHGNSGTIKKITKQILTIPQSLCLLYTFCHSKNIKINSHCNLKITAIKSQSYEGHR